MDFRASPTSRIISARRASGSVSGVASTGGASMTTKSAWPRSSPSTVRSAGRCRTSAGSWGSGPGGTTRRF